MNKLLALLLALLVATPAVAQQTVDPNRLPPHLEPSRTANGLGLTPPMGWNSWNKFGCNVNEEIVRRTADAIVASGMRAAGYLYVIVDDCWQSGRGADGNIVEATRFRSRAAAITDLDQPSPCICWSMAS